MADEAPVASGSRTPNLSLSGKSRPATVTAQDDLPEGCTWGPQYVLDERGQPVIYAPSEAEKSTDGGPTEPAGRIIWVDFPPLSPSNPFHFSRRRKLAIVGVATYFTGMTAAATSSYAIGVPSMCRDLGCTEIQAAAGLAIYAWGFGIAPLALAPLSEEYGRKWTYIIAVFLFTILHLMLTFAKNIATVLVGRLLIGASGSLGATLVGGTISDIYIPEERGLPMAIFALMAMFFTGAAPIFTGFIEARPDLGWRWIQWIEMIAIGAYIPFVLLILTETRAPVIIRRLAADLRKKRGETDGGRYTARSEMGRQAFFQAMRYSIFRPLMFLVVEPVVTFFSVWIAVAWGIFYTVIQGTPVIYPDIYGFSTTQTGFVYVTMCIGSLIGFGCNFIQDAVYRRKVAKHGVEARLYAPMLGGMILFAACMLYAFTVRPDVHWVVPAIAITIVIACIITLYITGFVYLSECYGSYASSALAAQSFLRNMFGGAFSMFTEDMYRTLTPRWAIFLMGMVAGVLGIVPFIAFWKGPEIRARSRFSRILMAEEKRRVEEAEKAARDPEAGGESGRISVESNTEGPDDIGGLENVDIGEDRGQGGAHAGKKNVVEEAGGEVKV